MTDILDRYVGFWNAQSPEDQRRLAASAFADDVEYYAPIGTFTGTQALIDFRNEFAGRMGSVAFNRRHDPQIHHGRARLAWEIEVRDGESFAEGTDVIELGPDGRIRCVTTFLDRAPEGFEHHHEG